ncbi:DinB family protein [Planctomycetes bacterium Pan216]|uniref:DinB family protein n=1 Tax=Kolteria novifilia TaxID=2527975 RepID=A0A518B5M9_9BACT|nr:DinB family protein [Planctomycetes bacterium Pan216]
MNALAIVRRLHEHRAWVNGKLLTAADTLPMSRLTQPLAIGQGSLWKTLVHLFAAEFVWLEALEGNPDPLLPGDVRGKLPGNQEGEGALGDVDELRRSWLALEDRWRAYLERLSVEDLERDVLKVSTSSGKGKTHVTRRADVLLHVCTHAQYTTAQAINMMRQLGVHELPDVMLISLARQQGASG